MGAFTDAVDRLFADANMGTPAVWKAGGVGSGVVVRVIRKSPDDVSEWNGARVVRDTEIIDIRVSDAPELAGGDVLTIDGTTYAVQGAPRRDRERLVWTVELRPQ